MAKFKQSIGDWMIENLGEDAIEKYWSKRNEELGIEPFKIASGTSSIKVWMMCQKVDYHGEYETTPKRFTIQGSRCSYCGNHHVHPKDSFAQWGIDTFGEDFFNKYWSEKNEDLGIDPWKLSKNSNSVVYIKCQEKEHHGDYDVKVKRFNSLNCRCPYCTSNRVHPFDSFAQWLINEYGENALDLYWSKKNEEFGIDPWKLPIQSAKKVWLKCQNKDYHPDYDAQVGHFVRGVGNCSYCGNFKVHPLDSLAVENPISLLLWSDRNNETPFDYTPNSAKKVWWICENKKHKDYFRTICNSNSLNFECPKCALEEEESKLQKKSRLFLTDELKFNTLHEHDTYLKCINPSTTARLLYDNEIHINSENKLIAEVHGKQHYEINGFHVLAAKKNGTTPEFELAYQQWKDNYKKEYALSQGYHYLEIPYWTDNEEKEWKQLIINKINEIKQLNAEVTIQC